MAWKNQRLQDHFVILCQELNVDSIVPILRAEKMLTADEVEQLINPCFTTQNRRHKLLLIIPRKGRDNFEKFCECLVWSGQEELAAKLGVPVSDIPPSPHPPPQRHTPAAQQQEGFLRMLKQMLSDGMGPAGALQQRSSHHAAAVNTSTYVPRSTLFLAPTAPLPQYTPSSATSSSSSFAVHGSIQATEASESSYIFQSQGYTHNPGGHRSQSPIDASNSVTRNVGNPEVAGRKYVFILYCNDEQMGGGDFSDSVQDLVVFLTRICGQMVNIICDLYETSQPSNWTRWTEHQIKTSDHVLMVCSKTLKEIMLDRHDPDRPVQMKLGHFNAEVVYNLIRTPKFIPVFLNHTEQESPVNLFSEPYHSWIPAQLHGVTRYWLDLPGLHKNIRETSREKEYQAELSQVLREGNLPRSVDPLLQLVQVLQGTSHTERPTPFPWKPIIPPPEPSNPELSFSTQELQTIASRIPQDWQTLGIKLGITYPVLETIRTRNHGDIQQAILEMLTMWQKEKRELATRAALRDALEGIGYRRLAQDVFH